MNGWPESTLKSIRIWAVVATASLAAACSTLPRAPAPPPTATSAAPAGFPARVRFIGVDPESFDRRAKAVMEAVRASAQGSPVNVLALSGGGAGGSFGAGALVGMSRRGDRPTFHIVTGVSVGALLAPFAFLGSDWDPQMLEALSDPHIRKKRLLHVGGPAILFRSSVYAGGSLRAFVDGFVTQHLVDAVAGEAARGRLLLVATTDLDKAETVIWDLGAIAAQGGEQARTLFRDVLVASASIPGIFPPVLIHVRDGAREYDEMHVDGGTTTPFLVAPEISQVDAGRALDLHGGKIYVLVNGSLSASTITTPDRALPVISRGFSASSMHGSRKTVELAAEFARRNGMELEFSSIPASYPYRGPLGFETEEVRRLFEYGERCAETGGLWTRLEATVGEGRRTRTNSASELTCPGAADESSRFTVASSVDAAFSAKPTLAEP